MVTPGPGCDPPPPPPGWIIPLLPALHSPRWNWLPSSSLLFLQVKPALHPPLPPPLPSAGEGPLRLPMPGVPPAPLAHHCPAPGSSVPSHPRPLTCVVPEQVGALDAGPGQEVEALGGEAGGSTGGFS